MRSLIIVVCFAATAGLAGCANQGGYQSASGTRTCGIIGCISSPYTKAKMGNWFVGQPLEAAIDIAGPPDKSFDNPSGTSVYSWSRRQNTSDFGLLQCTETIHAKDGKILTYSADGNC